jgi:hypothetical protein
MAQFKGKNNKSADFEALAARRENLPEFRPKGTEKNNARIKYG